MAKYSFGDEEFVRIRDFQVNITTPSDHVLAATGVLPTKEVMTETQLKRFKQAETITKPSNDCYARGGGKRKRVFNF